MPTPFSGYRGLALLALLALALASPADACSPPAPMRPAVAPGNASIPDHAHATYAFIAVVAGHATRPVETPVVELRVVDAWNARVAVGERVEITFREFACPDRQPRPARVDVTAFPIGTRIRVVANSLSLDPGRIGWEFSVIGVAP